MYTYIYIYSAPSSHAHISHGWIPGGANPHRVSQYHGSRSIYIYIYIGISISKFSVSKYNYI